MTHDRYDVAVTQLLLVRDQMPRGSIARCQTTARLADAWLYSDEPRQALGAARNARRECEAALLAMTAATPVDERGAWLAVRSELEVAESRALAATGEVDAALARTDAALATVEEMAALQPGNAGVEMLVAVARARARSARGAVLAMLGRHSSALDDLEAARQLWAQSVKRVEHSAMDLHQKVLLLLYRVGNLKMAQQHLSEAERITLPLRGEAWTALRVAASRLDAVQDGPAAAKRRLHGCCPPDAERIPRTDVRVAVGALAAGHAAPAADNAPPDAAALDGSTSLPYLALLARAVARIGPAGAARARISAALPDLAP